MTKEAMLSKLEIYRKSISEELDKTEFPNNPAYLYEPVRYILSLGGKRMRPILAMMGCEMFAGDFKQATNTALAVEIFHNFTLIHDDIMDEAPLRRGYETIHKKWNVNIGLLSGDFLMIESYKRLSKYDSDILPQILELYNTTAIEVCEGQQMDMDFEQLNDVTIEDYTQMIKLKTAVLVGCSLQMGAIVGRASEKNAQDLYEFGTNLGLAFQLQDDILDVYADQNKFGKQVGGDIIANKKTYLLLTALETASKEQKIKLETLFTEPDFAKKVEEVKKIYAELNIQKRAEEQMNAFYKIALAKLDAIEVEDHKKEPLRAIAMYLLDRES